MLLFPLGIFLSRDGCEFGEIDLVTEFRFLLVAVYREEVRSQDYVYGFP